MRALNEIGLRAIVYQESFGPDPNLAEENVGKLRLQLDRLLTLETDLVRAGVSPHAPYTVSGRQLQMISRLANDNKLPVMMHAAESASEKQFMLSGVGPFADGLRARGIDWQAPATSTVRCHGRRETATETGLLCPRAWEPASRQPGLGTSGVPRRPTPATSGRRRR